MDSQKENKKQNKFVSFMKAVFVHNFGWKLLALGSAIILWALAVGLW